MILLLVYDQIHIFAHILITVYIDLLVSLILLLIHIITHIHITDYVDLLVPGSSCS